MRIFSYGGGVQSFAALVLAAQGELDGCTTFVMSNVGDDSEMPATLQHFRTIALPYAEAHGLQLIEVARTWKDKRPRSIYKDLVEHPTAIPIPVRNADGVPFQRNCTRDYKVDVVHAWLRKQGVKKTDPAHVGLGISLDEYQRANSNSYSPLMLNWYPLLDRRLTRQDCVNTITRAGLPVPPKSACWFCPFTRMSEWHRMKQEQPGLFAQAVVLERDINVKLAGRGKRPVFLTGTGKYLDDVVGDQALMDFDGDMCESGHCMT